MDRSSWSSSKPADDVASIARLTVSFLLFLHLFCVLVAMTSGQLASQLEDALRRRVPGLRPYIQALLLDFSYAFTYTYSPGDSPDADTVCWVDVELTMPDGSVRNEVVPPQGLSSRLRMRRYERLAYQAANWAASGNQSLESAFPRNIVRELVNESGATGGKLSVRWRQLGADPFVTTGREVRTNYEARILVDPDTRAVELFKIESAAEVAPKADQP